MPHWSHPSIYASPRVLKKHQAQHRPMVTGRSPEAPVGALFEQALAAYAGQGGRAIAPVPQAQELPPKPSPRQRTRRVSQGVAAAAVPGPHLLPLGAVESLLCQVRRALSHVLSVLPGRRKAAWG